VRKLTVIACLLYAFTASSLAATRYIVVAPGQGNGSTAAVAAAVKSAGGTTVKTFEKIGILVAESSAANFAATLQKSASVTSVAPDKEVQWINPVTVEATSIEPGQESLNAEPYSAYQWNMRVIGADKTAAAGYLGQGARVAVLDAGVWTMHPDISPNLNMALSTSFVPSEPDVNPYVYGFNHGTHVAGIIAAPINNRGIQGVAPLAEIVAVKVLSSATGSGSFAWLIEGILYASGPEVHADVINMSLGATFDRINAGGDGSGPLIAALARAVNHATAAGTLVVASAGNEGVNLNSRLWSIPAQSGNGMAVSATAPYKQADFDNFASYSNYGQSVINVAAPGGDYLTGGSSADMVLAPGGMTAAGASQYFFAAGTSMAAPHVSGLAALLVGKYGHMSPAKLQALIEKTAVDLYKPGADAYSGKGRIDAWAALQ